MRLVEYFVPSSDLVVYKGLGNSK